MATTTRPELSKKNQYWIERHRFYELKHFCLQYPIWRKAYHALDGLSRRPQDLALFLKDNHISDPTAACAEAREYYQTRMRVVERAAVAADNDLAKYILVAVTQGLSYEALRAKYNVPCCKDVYYVAYRRFFYTLDKLRG